MMTVKQHETKVIKGIWQAWWLWQGSASSPSITCTVSPSCRKCNEHCSCWISWTGLNWHPLACDDVKGRRLENGNVLWNARPLSFRHTIRPTDSSRSNKSYKRSVSVAIVPALTNYVWYLPSSCLKARKQFKHVGWPWDAPLTPQSVAVLREGTCRIWKGDPEDPLGQLWIYLWSCFSHHVCLEVLRN